MIRVQTGEDIEYYEHRYQNQRTEEKYVFKLLKKSTLPTFPHTFNNMSLALESWMHVKVSGKENFKVEIA